MARMRIAKTGGSIGVTASKELALDSDYPCLNVIADSTTSITTNGSGNGSVNITHSLGYYPVYKVYAKEKSTSNLTDYWCLIQSVYGGSSYATTSVINVAISGGKASATYNVFVMVFGNEPDDAVGTSNSNISGKSLIAKASQNLETATDVRQLTFQSGKYVLKLDSTKSGTTASTVVAANSVAVIDVTHSLGYVPVAFAADVSAGGTDNMVPGFYVGIGAVYFGMSSTKLRFEIDNSTNPSPETYQFKYYIFRDKIA